MSHYANYPNPELCAKYGCIKLKNILVNGCPGCNLSQIEKQKLNTVAYNKAVQYANEIKKLVVLYDDDEGLPKYMEAEAAKLAGVRITGYIPFVSGTNN